VDKEQEKALKPHHNDLIRKLGGLPLGGKEIRGSVSAKGNRKCLLENVVRYVVAGDRKFRIDEGL